MANTLSAFVRAAGLRLDEVGPTRVKAWIALGSEHHQPSGIVHGGVYATAIETAAGIGASAAAQEQELVAVGLNNNTHFLRAMSAGRVSVDAHPIQQGRTQQLWEVRISDEEGRLVAIGQVRFQNIAHRGSSAK
jgi:uncharacterized protein (TIGR00369 family)